ncbi:MAG: translation initiation factor IF-3 [Candidatus Magasanikbacteria bacterium CG10_big_fil_rev_8_21_14_0_10_40_10]|uniref:Translation initiation factor IF-3 n=1 Tax=Candidatus Magasanikbacteria bacterium CG10_big_fil_rev_8_21_14_0_10_40_10 TaxID=1974648 RepID=A0A2M6W4T5_9BACT|nr:MAG: translation initiation factor IF-3 [Candidatus Magasanikbacteria bacterium CG10_big_fil_rev_8_21_14_0_10_40_10]
MRISRKKKKPQAPVVSVVYNERIKVPKVLVLNLEGSNLGVMNTTDAIRLAREQENDLVLINPKNDPPVAKMMDYGQYKYQKEKEDRIRRAKTHVTDTKGVRLSLRIGPHDLEIRRNQSLKFLNQGDKVKLEIILRGRENQQKPQAKEVMENFVKSIEEITGIRREQNVEIQFNKITAIIAKK